MFWRIVLRIALFISKFLDLASAIVSILTLSFYDPMWGFWFTRFVRDLRRFPEVPF
jgi:hypothetical protein